MLLLLLAPMTWAGPWVRPPGEAYLKTDAAVFEADAFVGPDGAEVAGADYRATSAQLYGEIGLVGPVQAVINLPFVGARNTLGDVPYANRGFGDMDVGIESGARVGGILPVSVQLLAKLPLYDNAELLQYGPSSSRFPALGDGQLDLTALAAVGSGVAAGGFRGWWLIEAGYRHRTEVWWGDSSRPDRILRDGIPWRGQLGWSPRIGGRDAGWWALDANGIRNVRDSD
ncbi:MAG: hypothetical protein VX000_05885, partial [Myxococcota bacterium]|nr:hypothetical protein [Myxococcota bacterium]